MDDVKITAEFQRSSCSGKQVSGGAVVFPSGKGIFLAGRATGKIGGIGQAHIKAAAFQRNGAQVSAYTFHTGGKGVAADVFPGGGVGIFAQLNAGDVAFFIACTQQHAQCAAAGTQVQDMGIFGQTNKVAEQHGIGTEGECAAGGI